MDSEKNKLLGRSVLLLLVVSPVVATAILYSLHLLLLPYVIISAIACSGIVFGLAFLEVISKINQEKKEKEETFLKNLKTYCENKNVKELENLLKKKSVLGISDKKIKDFLEKQGEDDLGTPFLHEIIYLKNQKIFNLLFLSVPDLNWNVQNKNDQTILHIIAEKNDNDLPICLLGYTKNKLKFDLDIKDIHDQTPVNIRNNIIEKGCRTASSVDMLFRSFGHYQGIHRGVQRLV